MPIDLTKALAKLDRPPAGHNWVRFVRENKFETTKSILDFVKAIPKFTYQAGLSSIRDKFLLGIDVDTALAAARKSGAPAGRLQNAELIQAFFDYDQERGYPVGTCIGFEKQWFRISRELLVPVAPLVVMREKGKFVPVFVCGWSELALSIPQRRLLMSIYEDAFLSLTDFQSSPAEFLFFPKIGRGKAASRVPETWFRGDYLPLSQAELIEQVERFLGAREEARTILLTAREAEARQSENEKREPEDSSPQLPGLFDWGGAPKK